VARISDDVRAAVVADLRRTHGTPEGSYRLVAERHGVSNATVRRIGAAAGVSGGSESRAKTENATAVAIQTNAQRREALAARLLDVAEQAIRDLENPVYTYAFGGKDGLFNEAVAKRPNPADRRQLLTTAGIALDKHAVLERFDSAGAAGQQADLLLRLLTGQAPPAASAS
jgi:transposase-like protein